MLMVKFAKNENTDLLNITGYRRQICCFILSRITARKTLDISWIRQYIEIIHSRLFRTAKVGTAMQKEMLSGQNRYREGYSVYLEKRSILWQLQNRQQKYFACTIICLQSYEEKISEKAADKVLFLLDISRSQCVFERISYAKSTIMNLLTKAF